MIDRLLADLNGGEDEEALLQDDDDDDVHLMNPVDDEEALKESKFLEECMNVLKDGKKKEEDEFDTKDEVNLKR